MIYIDAIAYQSRYSGAYTKSRISFILLGIIGSSILDSPLIYAILFAFSFMTIFYLTKQNLGNIMKIIIVPLLFVFISSGLVILTISSKPSMDALFQFKFTNMYLFITENSLERGLGVLIRSVSILLQAFSISLTMPIQEVILWMRWLRVPSAFVQLFTLTYRMIFVVSEEAQQLVLSQTLRFGFSRPSTIFNSMTDLCKILFLRTFWRLDDMEIAMNLRFFDEI